MKSEALKVNGIRQPIGYDFNYLTFSWMYGKGNQTIQNDFEQYLDIANDPSFSTLIFHQRVDSVYNSLSIDPHFLTPRARYYWRVCTINGGKVYYSDSFFETGKQETEWEAKWLTYKEEPKNSISFKLTFDVKTGVKKARLYCCALGIYEPYLNQTLVTDEVLLPGYHSYDLVNQYQTFDVTKSLKEKNDLELMVGNGWFKGRFVFEGGYSNIYGQKQRMIAELIIDYEDGTTEKICSGVGNWRIETNQIQENSIYDGELIDLSISKFQQLTPMVDSIDPSLLAARTNVPIKKKSEIYPERIFYDSQNDLIIDFGQNITGWIEGEIDSKEEYLTFEFSELMQNGRFYRDNLRTAEQTFCVKGLNGRYAVRPHFTFFGYRYVRIKGLTKKEAAKLKAVPIYSEMDELFAFDSSNSKLNQLVSNIKWSQKDNFLDIPTDCPQRDERMGWTGDVTIFANTSCYNYETKGFYSHYLSNLALEQKVLNGSVPFFVPFPKIEPHEGINPFLISHGASVWGDVATTLPYNLYKHYKDKDLLKQHIPIMKEWVDYIRKRDIEHGDKYLWDFDRQLGDWLALDNGNPQNPIGATDPDFIASIYYYRSAHYLSACLDEINDPQVAHYKELARKIREAILRKYVPEGKIRLGTLTQTGLALLIRYDMFPSKASKQDAAKKLADLLSNNNGFLNTGFVGTPELPHALIEAGLVEEAFTLLFKEEMPSWLYEVNQGATTIWERWNSILPDGTISGTEMNSLNHYAYGAVGDFIVEKLGGLTSVFSTNQRHQYTIEPYFTKLLAYFTIDYKTPNGPLRIQWDINRKHALTITVPMRTIIKYVDQDSQSHLLTEGKHAFIVNI